MCPEVVTRCFCSLLACRTHKSQSLTIVHQWTESQLHIFSPNSSFSNVTLTETGLSGGSFCVFDKQRPRNGLCCNSSSSPYGPSHPYSKFSIHPPFLFSPLLFFLFSHSLFKSYSEIVLASLHLTVEARIEEMRGWKVGESQLLLTVRGERGISF